ncbi:putative late blight resistance protein-like protein R1B-16 [Forsythia ovata]|uniref:Late blight resistance protein-like protein R1B-16 n=1 Tax=Forsythia ovata TaxID=205694 RepID=A0ABD1XGZ7_9LAMI
MVTTRLDNVGGYANSCSTPHHMRFLNEGESWNLFCENAFGKDGCPTELKQVGKKIVQNCQGLPLAIVVIDGLLSKATKTQHCWTYIGENLSSVMASNDDNYSKILSLSYKHLPHHLKECFLYIGIFPADYDIRISKLVKLWVAERLLKPVRSKSLEDVAREYLLELVDRNLILVRVKSSIGKIKSCGIYDLLRDSCVREAQREKFFHVNNMGLCGISEGTKVRRFSIHFIRKLSDLDKCLQNMRLRSTNEFPVKLRALCLAEGMPLLPHEEPETPEPSINKRTLGNPVARRAADNPAPIPVAETDRLLRQIFTQLSEQDWE